MDTAVTADGRYAEKRRRATEMTAAWVDEDAAPLVVDLDDLDLDLVIDLRPVVDR